MAGRRGEAEPDRGFLSSSGFYGVSFNKAKNKFRSQLQNLTEAEREAMPERYRSSQLVGGHYATGQEAAMATDK